LPLDFHLADLYAGCIPMSVESRPGQYSLEEVVEIAQEVILEHGNHVPTIIVQGEKGSAINQLVPFPETHEGRQERMFIAGLMLAQSGRIGDLKQVFFISEAWMSAADEDGPPRIPPSQDPKRIEVLIITHLEVEDQRTELALYEMIRDAEGRLADLLELEQPGTAEGGHVESPLLSAFVEGFRQGAGGQSEEQRTSPEPLFSLGQVVATPGALRTMEEAGQDPLELLSRHVTGDWGDLVEEDRKENELSVERGFRILSAYVLSNGEKIWLGSVDI
jgi:hypothetical protein